MNVGIFETVFERQTLKEQFVAVSSAGLSSVQFHYASAGLESRPASVPAQIVERVRANAEEAAIRIAAVSGTYNMIHPSRPVRDHGLASLEAIAASCNQLGASIITLCTGTRSWKSQWTIHPDNELDDAWDDLLASMESALAIADRYGVTMAVEPEPANVASDAKRARQLLDTMSHPRLKIVLDPANILASSGRSNPEHALSEAFDLLGDRVVLAHAKDLSATGAFCAAGTGIVPWQHYRSLLEDIDFDGDVILHTLGERDVPLAASLFA